MKLFSKRLRSDSFSNLIAAGTTIEGDISFTGTIKIQGKVCGDALSGSAGILGDFEDCIIIDVGGEVTSNKIKVSNAIIAGRATSNVIWAEDTLRIASTAEVIGAELFFRNLEIEPGALVNGCKLFHLDHCSASEQV